MKQVFYLLLVLCPLFFEGCLQSAQPSASLTPHQIDSLLKPAYADLASGDPEAAKAKAQLLSHSLIGTPGIQAVDKFLAIVDSVEAERRADLAKRAESLKKKMRKEVDDMRGLVFYYHPSSTKFVDRNDFFLYISEKQSDVSLRMRIQYAGDDWLFIERYYIKMDSVVAQIVPISSVERDNGYGGVWEYYDTVMDATDFEMMQDLAQAKTAKLRYEGQQYYRERDITRTQRQAIQDMLDLYEAMGGTKPKM